MSQEVNISVNESSQEVNVSASENIQEVNITSVESVEYSPSYNNLQDLPTLFSGDYDDLTDKPVFVGMLATNSSSAIAGGGILTFKNTQLDSNSAFDGTKWTCPVGKAGWYRIGATVTVNLNNAKLLLGNIQINGTNVFQFGRESAGVGGQSTVSGDSLLYLNEGDEVQVYAYSSDTFAAYGSDRTEVFHIELLNPQP